MRVEGGSRTREEPTAPQSDYSRGDLPVKNLWNRRSATSSRDADNDKILYALPRESITTPINNP